MRWPQSTCDSPTRARKTSRPERLLEIPGIGRPVARAVLGTEGYFLSDYVFRGRILDAYLRGGENAIDTARLYAMRGRGWTNGCGEAELLLGRWMAERGNRDRVVLITKGAHRLPRGLSLARMTKGLHRLRHQGRPRPPGD